MEIDAKWRILLHYLLPHLLSNSVLYLSLAAYVELLISKLR